MRANSALGWGGTIGIRVGRAVGLSAMTFIHVFQKKTKMPEHAVTCSVQVDHETVHQLSNKTTTAKNTHLQRTFIQVSSGRNDVTCT